MEIFIFLIVMGVITGMIANGKKHSFFSWFIYGFFLGIIAIVHACIIKDKEEGKKCPKCLSIINDEAQVCKYCRHKFTEENFKVAAMKKEEQEKKKSENDYSKGKNIMILTFIAIAAYILIQVGFAVNFFPRY